ncbi:MAG: phosphate acyltransferase [Saccharofermentanales bacterium]|jgi:phosphate butyryltransferase
MIRSFADLYEAIRQHPRVTISVAAAQDKEALLCVKAAYDKGIAEAILVGDEGLIRPLIKEVGLPETIRVVNEPDVKQAASTAVKLIRDGEARILLKGSLNTSDYLKAVLNPDIGLRTGRLLGSLAAYQYPGGSKLLFATDTGVNILPNFDEKKQLLQNAFAAMKKMGIDRPKVACLAANENVNPKIPSTVDARRLQEYFTADPAFAGIIEGPVAMDVALSAEAARHKGLDSQVAGDVDLLLFSSVDAGNIWSKSLIHFAGFSMANVILGATHPVVLVSRADTAEIKLNSVALACLLAARSEH